MNVVIFSGNKSDRGREHAKDMNPPFTSSRSIQEKIPAALANCIFRPIFIFYLIIYILQIVFKPAILPIVTFVPLLLSVFTSAMIDLTRYLKKKGFAKRINKRKVQVLSGNSWILENWNNLEPGDIIKINNGEYVPADVIVLRTSDNQQTSIDTHIIDGSSQWQPKSAPLIPEFTEATMINSSFSIHDIKRESSEDPQSVKPLYTSKYVFSAKLNLCNREYELENKNLIEKYSTVYHNGYIICGVVYTGSDCWTVVNNPFRPRQTRIENSIRKQNIWEMEIVVILSFVLSLLSFFIFGTQNKDVNRGSYFCSLFFNYVILLLPIAPLELFSFIDAANLFISNFQQVSYEKLFINSCDVMDEMCNINTLVVSKSMLLERKPCLKRIFLNNHIYGSEITSRELSVNINNVLINSGPLHKKFYDPSLVASDENRIFFLHLALCHSASIVGKKDMFNYISRFPDDEQLLNLAASRGFMLVGRTQDESTLLIGEQTCKFKTIRIIHSSQKHPRISIIVEDSEGNIILFTRGVFRVMTSIVNNIESVQYVYDKFHEEGLHTECISYKVITKKQYEQFEKKLAEYGDDNSEFWFYVIEGLESGSTFVSVLGFEDQPRDGSLLFLSRVRQAFNQIVIASLSKGTSLIITGISLGIINTNPVTGTIKGTTMEDVEISASYVLEQSKYDVLIITGQSIEYLPVIEYDKEVLSLICNTPTIILQRADQKQVGLFIEYLQKYSKQYVMGIGHSIYDSVFMEKANISVSIPTSDIRPNALSADIVVNSYEQLANLLFIDGNILRERINTLIKFTEPRNLVFVCFQFWYSFFQNFQPNPLFPEFMQLWILYLCTFIPLLLRTIFNVSYSKNALSSDASFYKRDNRNFMTKGKLIRQLLISLGVTFFVTMFVRWYNFNTVESSRFLFIVVSIFVFSFNSMIIPTVDTWNVFMKLCFAGSYFLFYLLYFVWSSTKYANKNRRVFFMMMKRKSGFLVIAVFVVVAFTVQFLLVKREKQKKNILKMTDSG